MPALGAWWFAGLLRRLGGLRGGEGAALELLMARAPPGVWLKDHSACKKRKRTDY